MNEPSAVYSIVEYTHPEPGRPSCKTKHFPPTPRNKRKSEISPWYMMSPNKDLVRPLLPTLTSPSINRLKPLYTSSRTFSSLSLSSFPTSFRFDLSESEINLIVSLR